MLGQKSSFIDLNILQARKQKENKSKMATLGCFSQSAFYPVQSSMHAFVPTYDFSTPLKLETSTPNQGFQGIKIPFWSYLLLISSCVQVKLKKIFIDVFNKKLYIEM